MATLASVHGTAYGVTPNNPLTWDASKIMGCLCDYPYKGYDCSLMLCPFGDDPVTLHQADEQQTISCVDSDSFGTVVLSLGRFTSTVTLAASATSSDIKAAIEAIPFAGITQVVASGSGTLCGATGTTFTVTFLSLHGDLPMLTAQTNAVDSIEIQETVKGSKENIECSGRGLCDQLTGTCSCFSGFASSDGMGGLGTLGDCGYMNPVTI